MELYNAIIGTLGNVFEGFDAASAVLLAMLAAGAYVMFKAQQRDDFDWADMLRDDNGKPSSFRLAIFVCLGVSSWLLIYLTIKLVGQVTVSWADTLEMLFKWYALYVLVFSGAKIAERIVEIAYVKIVGRDPLPPAKPAAPPSMTMDAAAGTITATTGAPVQ